MTDRRHQNEWHGITRLHVEGATVINLVIFDTEFTAWEGSQLRGWSEPWEYKELIQLAAMKVVISDNQQLRVLASFNEIIKPVINPRLSHYITELTGISQATVDEMGVDFSSALSMFHKFCDDGQISCCSWGNDHEVMVTNCGYYDLTMPYFSHVGNLQALAQALNVHGAQVNSGELAATSGVHLEGHNHNALFDVRSIVTALTTWLSSNSMSYDELKQFTEGAFPP